MNTTRIKRLLVGILSAIALPTFGGDAARAADLPASTEIDAALNAAYEKDPNAAGWQERGLYSGAFQGGPEDLWDRAGDQRRQNLHRGRRDFGGVDPVDFQGVHDGKGHGKFGIAVVSPPLDAAGNSVRAQKAIADISNALDGNPYAIKPRK